VCVAQDAVTYSFQPGTMFLRGSGHRPAGCDCLARPDRMPRPETFRALQHFVPAINMGDNRPRQFSGACSLTQWEAGDIGDAIYSLSRGRIFIAGQPPVIIPDKRRQHFLCDSVGWLFYVRSGCHRSLKWPLLADHSLGSQPGHLAHISHRLRQAWPRRYMWRPIAPPWVPPDVKRDRPGLEHRQPVPAIPLDHDSTIAEISV